MRLLEKISKRKNETLRKIYKEIFHWEPVFFTISKNKLGFKIADFMKIFLTGTPAAGSQTECAMICTTIMPHFFLQRSKSENDASLAKTLSRKLDLWIRGNFDDLFVEAKVHQESLRYLNRKREVVELKVFDKQMESVKISNALRCLSDEVKGGVLSTSDKVTMKRKNCTALALLKKITYVVRKFILNR